MLSLLLLSLKHLYLLTSLSLFYLFVVGLLLDFLRKGTYQLLQLELPGLLLVAKDQRCTHDRS